MNDFILGRYSDKNTLIHRLDPRTKIFLMLILMTAIFLDYGTYFSTLLVQGALLIVISLLLFLSKINIKNVFSSLKILWFTIIFLFIINLLIPNPKYTYLLFSFNGSYGIYLEGILQSVKIILRISISIILTLVLTSTTKPNDLSKSFEWFFFPLKYIGFPSAELAMVISLTLRFIPTILEEALKLKKAQEARGVDFEHGSIGVKIKAMISLIVPLFVGAFSRSSELAEALEVRGYIPNKRRTQYKKLSFKLGDLISTLLICVISAGFFTLSYYNLDLIEALFGISNAITILR
ncbi:MAG: energy-coupling factor transporter transmembrane component T [Bacilli bacterium]